MGRGAGFLTASLPLFGRHAGSHEDRSGWILQTFCQTVPVRTGVGQGIIFVCGNFTFIVGILNKTFYKMYAILCLPFG